MNCLSIKYLTSLSLTSSTLPIIVSTIISTIFSLLIIQPAGAFTVTFEHPDTQSSTKTTNTFEIDFDEIDLDGAGNVTSSGVTYTYSSDYEVIPADQYGGADGTGEYIRNSISDGTSFRIDISADQDYFGFWWSAGDSANTIKLYDNDSLVFTFDTQDIIDLLPNTSGTTITSIDGQTAYNTQNYYGNPNTGQNTPEPYAFINFYAEGSEVYNRIDFENPDARGRFESDNHTFSTFAQSPNQNVEVYVPFNFSPTIGLLLSGCGLLGIRYLKQRRQQQKLDIA